MLKSLPFKPVYSSDKDNLIKDFYIPALSVSVRYDRAVGFFSSSMLSYAAQGIAALIENGGRMRLIFGGELDAQDSIALEKGYADKNLIDKLGEEYREVIDDISTALLDVRMKALSWMVATGKLDIRVALREKGMFHDKLGIIADEAQDQIVFQGSANETAYALLPDFNFESINIFPSWEEAFAGHYNAHIGNFENLWGNKARNTLTIDFPEAAQQRMIQIYESDPRPPKSSAEVQLWDELHKNEGNEGIDIPGDFVSSANSREDPKPPKGFKLHEHQKKALDAWKGNKFQGVLELATGSGKTLTSIYGLTRLYESKKRLFVVISVPYQALAAQWVLELRKFQIVPVECYQSKSAWEDILHKKITRFSLRSARFCCVVVVNRTLQSDAFQNAIKKVDANFLLFIGDECHHLNTSNFVASLPPDAKFRLGLSATPEDAFDDEKTANVLGYFGEIVFEYGLKEALEDEVLTPYNYHLTFCDLNEDEADEFNDLANRIAKAYARACSDSRESTHDNSGLNSLVARKARLLSKVNSKYEQLERLLDSTSPSKFSLFYCGDGMTDIDASVKDADLTVRRQVEAVSEILYKNGWSCSSFTAQESPNDRKRILGQFKAGIIDAIVAIRCLDEGIDVPACRTAYLLASSCNPRQFIQRRGRILRKSLGKERADIYDFIVRLPKGMGGDGGEREKKLFKSELKRIAKFTKLAKNFNQICERLEPILEEYGLAADFINQIIDD
ncbi:MAG: DEAD/DEAH box helicase family protein [Candidatus Eutrophobiaceae bacterium]